MLIAKSLGIKNSKKGMEESASLPDEVEEPDLLCTCYVDKIQHLRYRFMIVS